MTRPSDPQTLSTPALELPVRLGWRFKYTEIIFWDPPFLMIQATPDFPGCHAQLAERGIVWDFAALWHSIRQPGGYFLLTSDCGYPPDSGIEEHVLVSHPDAQTVIWELDIQGLRPALDESILPDEGFLRLVFVRDEYEADIRAMLSELRHRMTTPVDPRTLANVHGLDHLLKEYPAMQTIHTGEFEPNTGDGSLDWLLALDIDASCQPQPLWLQGTLIEFGCFGADLMAVNGDPRKASWPTSYFTRWQALAAFKAWLAFVQRGAKGSFVLRDGSDVGQCHAAGRRLAQVLQQCFAEGVTTPGVSIRYRECGLSVAGFVDFNAGAS